MAAPLQRPHHVLIVEDDPDCLDLLRRLCGDVGLTIVEAHDGETALALARERAPDLVLTDLVLPGMDGLEFIQTLRAERRFNGAPVIVLSARRTQESKVAAFRAGAADYVEKPFLLGELEARLAANLRQRELFESLERANWELRLANERLAELAATDELTGLCNARRLRERLVEEFARADRYQVSLALVLADLDGFKRVNDDHGHPIGDRLLAQVAQRLRAQARSTDIVGRLGGDEFAFLLPHTGLNEAVTLADRLCDRVRCAPIRLAGGHIAGVRLSCGVASSLETPQIASAAELMEAADAALYEAKRRGGGVAVAAEDRHRAAAIGPAQALPTERGMPRPRSPRGAGAA